MPQRAAMPLLANGREYLVLDNFGGLGSAFRETDLNTAENWARDVSADIARKVVTRARELDHELPAAVRDFVERARA